MEGSRFTWRLVQGHRLPRTLYGSWAETGAHGAPSLQHGLFLGRAPDAAAADPGLPAGRAGGPGGPSGGTRAPGLTPAARVTVLAQAATPTSVVCVALLLRQRRAWEPPVLGDTGGGGSMWRRTAVRILGEPVQGPGCGSSRASPTTRPRCPTRLRGAVCTQGFLEGSQTSSLDRLGGGVLCEQPARPAPGRQGRAPPGWAATQASRWERAGKVFVRARL